MHHLPSDELCHKILMSSVDDKDKEVVVQQRSKCLATIQEVGNGVINTTRYYITLLINGSQMKT